MSFVFFVVNALCCGSRQKSESRARKPTFELFAGALDPVCRCFLPLFASSLELFSLFSIHEQIDGQFLVGIDRVLVEIVDPGGGQDFVVDEEIAGGLG